MAEYRVSNVEVNATRFPKRKCKRFYSYAGWKAHTGAGSERESVGASQTLQEDDYMPFWYKITLTQADIFAGRHSKLQSDFDVIFMAMQAPADMGMFGSRDFGVSKQVYYFAIPEDSELFTKRFLENNSAQPCLKPKRSECSLLVGDAGVSGLLE